MLLGSPCMCMTQRGKPVSAAASKVDAGYEVAEVSQLLDAVHLMSYDMHGSWETSVDHHATLYREPGDGLTVDAA